MNTTVITYLVYLAISLALTVWVARALFRSGRRFLVDVYAGDESLADSLNRLLVVGFYLVNLGYVSLALRVERAVDDPRQAIEVLSWKLGTVLLFLGIVHFLNLYVFGRMRTYALAREDRRQAAAAYTSA